MSSSEGLIQSTLTVACAPLVDRRRLTSLEKIVVSRRSRSGVYGSVGLLMALVFHTPVVAQSPQGDSTPPSSPAQTPVTSSPSDSVRDSVRRPAHLPEVTVTTARTQPETPTSVVHVTPRVMALTPAPSPWELLRQAAGVEVHQQGEGPGFASDASVRGFSSDHSTDLALWIDGVPINEPVNGHAEGYNDWSLLFPQAVQDIDILKGPTSALFGNFALSGVVNVRTLERMRGTQVITSGGSYGRVDGTYLTGFDHGSAGGGVLGFRMAREDGFRPNSGNALGQGHARFVRDLAPGVTLDLGTELYDARWKSPGYLSEPEFDAHRYDVVSNPSDGGFKRHAQERASVRVTRVVGTNLLLWRTTAYATQGRWQLYLTIPPEGGAFEGSGSQTEEEDTRYGLGLTSAVSYITGRADVTAGVEGRFDHARYENYFTTARRRDSVDALVTGGQRSGAAFVQAKLDGDRRLAFTVGARYDALDTRSTPDSGSVVTAGHGVFSPKLGALWHLTRTVALYGNVSRGFRASDGVLFDPTLDPITVWAYESGVKLTRGDLTASAALFRMNVSNEQTFNPLTSGSSSGGRSRRQGVELGLHAPVARAVTLSGEWTFNDARYTERVDQGGDSSAPPVVLSGLRVYNTARYVGVAAIDVAPTAAGWALRVSGNWVGAYSPFDEPGVVLGGYGLLHVAGSVPLTPHVALELGVRNVLDRAYPEVVAGHIVAPGQPRSVYATFRYGS